MGSSVPFLFFSVPYVYIEVVYQVCPSFLPRKVKYVSIFQQLPKSLSRRKMSADVWNRHAQDFVRQPYSIGTTMLIDRYVRNSLTADAKLDLHPTNSVPKSNVKKHAKVLLKTKPNNSNKNPLFIFLSNTLP